MRLNKHIHLIRISTLRMLRLLMVALFCYLSATSLDAQWTKSVQFDDSDMALDLAEALTFQKYPTYYQYLEMMQGFATAYPEICRLDTIGLTTQDRLLLALKISDNVDEDEAEAAFLYTSSMHGNEIAGLVLLLRLADTLLNGYGFDTEINRVVDNLQIWINPLANPDGSYSTDNNLSLKNAFRHNLQNIDLNRNFPAPNAGDVDDTTGRAIENRYMMKFLRKHQFSLSANLHGGEEVVNYPWDKDSLLHADDNWYRFISREYADEAKAVDPNYMALFEDGITHGAFWYVAPGTRQDYVNYYREGREVTLELSLDKLLPSDELEHYWNINQRSLLNYISQCLYGIRGRVTDLKSGEPIRAKIEIPGHDSIYSVVHSSETHGDFYRLIKEGVYDLLASAPGYFSDTIFSVPVTDYQATLLDIALVKNPASGVDPIEHVPGFRIYPNPAVHTFMVEPENVPHGELKLSLYTLDGRIIYHKILSYHGSGIELSTKQLEPGIYLLRCSTGSLSEVQRLMVLKPF